MIAMCAARRLSGVAASKARTNRSVRGRSRLLRHGNVIITERYLNRLPQPNEGAIIMSDMLGLEDDDDGTELSGLRWAGSDDWNE